MIRVLFLVVASLAVAVAAGSRWDPPAQGFAERAFMMGALLAGVLPFVVAWHGQERRAGTPLLDLGRPDQSASDAFIAAFAFYGVQSIAAAIPEAHAWLPRFAALLGGLLVAAAVHWFGLARRRGLSLRDGGVLTPDDLVAWDEIFFWSCHRDGGTLVLGVRGVGWMRSLATGKPASDTMQTWRVPADRFEAAEALLVQRARQLTAS